MNTINYDLTKPFLNTCIFSVNTIFYIEGIIYFNHFTYQHNETYFDKHVAVLYDTYYHKLKRANILVVPKTMLSLSILLCLTKISFMHNSVPNVILTPRPVIDIIAAVGQNKAIEFVLLFVFRRRKPSEITLVTNRYFLWISQMFANNWTVREWELLTSTYEYRWPLSVAIKTSERSNAFKRWYLRV